jgi:hypothetical protein
VALEAYGAPHFFFFIHLLRNLGLGAMLQKVACKMLDSSAKAEYANRLQQSIGDIHTRKRRKSISAQQTTSFCTISNSK